MFKVRIKEDTEEWTGVICTHRDEHLVPTRASRSLRVRGKVYFHSMSFIYGDREKCDG